MTKKRVIFLIGSVLLIFLLLLEVYFLLVIRHQATLQKTLTTIQPSPISGFGPNGSTNAFNLPPGYFVISTNRSTDNLPISYTLLAKFIDATLLKDQTISAHISFAQDQGTGKTITQEIRIAPRLQLILQNQPTFFATPHNMQLITFSDGQKVFDTLRKWKGQAMIFTFNTYTPMPSVKPAKTNLSIDPQCNNLLLLALSSKYNPPSCTPVTQAINVYATF